MGLPNDPHFEVSKLDSSNCLLKVSSVSNSLCKHMYFRTRDQRLPHLIFSEIEEDNSVACCISVLITAAKEHSREDSLKIFRGDCASNMEKKSQQTRKLQVTYGWNSE